jgi:general nucleoside transport system permease protein
MTVYVLIALLAAGIKAGAPLLLGTLGEILTEKSGGLNMGVEGVMGVSAVAGLAAGFYTGSLALTLLAAILAGMLCCLIYSFMTVTLKANQLITGLSISILGGGVCNMMGAFVNSSAKAAKTTARLNNTIMSLFSGLDRGLSVGSDESIPLEYYVDKLLSGINFFVIIGVLLAVAMWFFFFKTRPGLHLRAVGENPKAADAMGISITVYRYLASVVGGAMMGLAGLFVCMNVGGKWEYNLIGGKGWLAVALVIFARWNPLKAIGGSLAFGILLRLYLHIKLSFLPDNCEALLMMLPYVITLITLIISGRRKHGSEGAPAGSGSNFFREDR